MRLIDADAVIGRIIDRLCADCDNYNGVRCRACNVDDAIDVIDTEESADPVKHGHWISVEIYEPYKNYGIKCSCCGFQKVKMRLKLPCYCENCGAKMDDEVR